MGLWRQNPKGVGCLVVLGFKTRRYYNHILSPSRYEPNLARSHRDLVQILQDSMRSWRIRPNISQIPMDFGQISARSRWIWPDLDGSCQISTPMTKLEIDRYNPKPETTWTGWSDENSESVSSFDFIHLKISGWVRVGY